ncbi:MSCRAMM family protein, partial [Dellaglioa algida]|uniref:MSCRAMM family protein n=1 Tax=Dellaglioa algida TaxID=105612 RepID=UPI0024C4D1D7
LMGAVFELQDEKGKVLQSGLTTDIAGKVAVSDLTPGNYQLVETKAPTGYDLDKTPVKFEIKKGQTTAVKVTKTNTLTKGGVILTKTDAKTGTVLAGAEFRLENQKGQIVATQLVTDQAGKLFIGDLKLGKYRLIETKAPTGYILDANPIIFEIKNGLDSVQIGMTNNIKKGSVVLDKIDGKTGKTLADAVFELQDEKGKVLQSGLTTDSSGKIAVSNLTPGNYQFVETKAPTGYDLDKTPVKFEIKKGQTQVTQVHMSNMTIKNSVDLTKIDDETGAALVGAEFELRNVTGKVIKQHLVTDNNGKIVVSGLSSGRYQFVETKAPKGYQIDRTPVEFIVKSTENNTVKVNKTNKILKGRVILTKVDNKTGETLSGAEFKLVNQKGNTIEKNIITDKNGEISISKLDAGKYYFVEMKAPSGYKLDTTPIKFTIKKGDNQVVKVIKLNLKKGNLVPLIPIEASKDDQNKGTNNHYKVNVVHKNQQKLPQTDEKTEIGYILIGTTLVGFSILGMILINKNRKRRHG